MKKTIFVRSDDDARLNNFNASKTGGESIRLKQYGSSLVTINVLVQSADIVVESTLLHIHSVPVRGM